jgi:biotin carboxyl carrier protein
MKLERITADQELVVNLLCFADGDTVPAGAEVIQGEILKMMVPVHCNSGGVIKYHVKQYDYVAVGSLLAEITYAS